jgi:hypothetical protein
MNRRSISGQGVGDSGGSVVLEQLEQAPCDDPVPNLLAISRHLNLQHEKSQGPGRLESG